MRVIRAEFRAQARRPAEVPPAVHGEVAMAGRSNVGKSSLLNRMVARKSLARTSRTPGCTRGLLFYDVDFDRGESATLVDLPGYGYASRSHAERDQWRKLVERYLDLREELACVLVLVDVRRGPEDEELGLLEYLAEAGIACGVVATKVDKLKRSARARAISAIRAAVGDTPVLPTSSQTGEGVAELWRWVRAAVARDPEPDVDPGGEGHSG